MLVRAAAEDHYFIFSKIPPSVSKCMKRGFIIAFDILDIEVYVLVSWDSDDIYDTAGHIRQILNF